MSNLLEFQLELIRLTKLECGQILSDYKFQYCKLGRLYSLRYLKYNKDRHSSK